MSLAVDVPAISVTPEAEEDDDHILLNLSEALTDVEDLFDQNEDDRSVPVTPIKKSKLRIKLPVDDAGFTDIEDFEASSDEGEENLAPHKAPVKLTDLDMEAPVVEESFKRKPKGKKQAQTQFATKHKSFCRSLSDGDNESDDEGVATNSEDYETDHEIKDDIPDTDFDPDLYKAQNLVAENLHNSRPSSPVSSSEHSEPSLPKSSLGVVFDDQGGTTDIEVLNSNSEDDLIKPKTRRFRHRKHSRSSCTDMEDVYFSGDDTPKLRKKHKRSKAKHLLVRSNTIPFESENEENDELPFPICKRIAQKKQVALRVPDFDSNFETDVEELEGEADLDKVVIDESALESKLKEIAAAYGEVEEAAHKVQKTVQPGSFVIVDDGDNVESEDTDEEFAEGVELNSPNNTEHSYKVKFSPSFSQPSSTLALPGNSEEPLTDCENLDSSQDEGFSRKIPLAFRQSQEFTEEEDFTEDETATQAFEDIPAPSPSRNLVLIQDNDTLAPTIHILPLESVEANEEDVSSMENATEEEALSSVEEAFDALEFYENPGHTVLPVLEGGVVQVRDSCNGERKSPDLREAATDTEDLVIDKGNRRKRAPKFKAMFLGSKSNVALRVPRRKDAQLTDTENVDVSEDDSATPCYKKRVGCPKGRRTKSPDTTDSEEVMASAEEDLAMISTPRHVHKELDQMCVSKVHDEVSRKCECEEVLYLKGGGGYSSPASEESGSEELRVPKAEELNMAVTSRKLEHVYFSKAQNEFSSKSEEEEVLYLKGGGYYSTNPEEYGNEEIIALAEKDLNTEATLRKLGQICVPKVCEQLSEKCDNKEVLYFKGGDCSGLEVDSECWNVDFIKNLVMVFEGINVSL
ncbi:uncharacterized protein [Euwallacea similis]|uniref:uncharacterized protein n=1 Tax=Euwallacea similis TaxID=1736056 RepID=UPI00344CD3FC